MGALLHDVGKIGIPDAILTKAGGLSPEEWECIQEHPVLGKQILEQAPELTDITPLVLHHQERYDGTGYPGKLSGEDIPLGARIIAAADAYHAIISDRPYRSRRSHSDAVRELSRCSGAQFDPEVVKNLLTVLETDDKVRALLPIETGRREPVTQRCRPRVACAPESGLTAGPDPGWYAYFSSSCIQVLRSRGAAYSSPNSEMTPARLITYPERYL